MNQGSNHTQAPSYQRPQTNQSYGAQSYTAPTTNNESGGIKIPEFLQKNRNK